MQAIVTRYRGPANVRGARIYARCSAGSTSIDYPHELRMWDAAGNDLRHRAAAEALCKKLGWDSAGYVQGVLPNGRDNVFVAPRD
jgi:hypothetical protein